MWMDKSLIATFRLTDIAHYFAVTRSVYYAVRGGFSFCVCVAAQIKATE